MIVRIFGEDQYRIENGLTAKMNELDHACVAAIESGDEARFHDAYRELLELIRKEGDRLGADELAASDLMLPPEDTSLGEARERFHGEGLLPG